LIIEINPPIVLRQDKTNKFGDDKLDLDVQTDSVICSNLKKSKAVSISLSEERPYPSVLNKEG
jgi:fructose-1,6-bisphosphatase